MSGTADSVPSSMPIGQPDSRGHEPVAERLISQAMSDGEFDDLPGTGRPIPGQGIRDDALWWVRSWVRRNSATDQDSSSSE